MTDIPDEAVEAAAANVNRLLDKRASQDLLATSHEIANAALTAAYSYLLDEDWRTDWENDLLANAPEWLDDDVAQCEIVTRYVRWLEAENARLRAQVEAAEKELAIANRVIRRHLPELVEAVRAEVAALSDEGNPDE